MHAHGVFHTVAGAIEAELARAVAALAPWPFLAPTPLLLQLCEGLRAQVRSLQPADAAG
jgi:hypothetical protein